MNNKSDYYNNKVKKWDDMLIYSPAPRARRRIILRLIKHNSKDRDSLHDIGCANGLLLNKISNKFKSLLLSGSDISNETIQINKKIYPDIEFYNLDIGKNISHYQQYDIITCSEVLEHVPEISVAIQNIKNMLKPGGTAIITMPKGKIYPIDKMVGHLQHFEDIAIFNKFFSIKDEIHWGFPFFNLYKFLININPKAMNKSFGESEYSLFNKLVSHFIYLLFQFNLPFWGEQLFLVLHKKN